MFLDEKLLSNKGSLTDLKFSLPNCTLFFLELDGTGLKESGMAVGTDILIWSGIKIFPEFEHYTKKNCGSVDCISMLGIDEDDVNKFSVAFDEFVRSSSVVVHFY